MFITDEDFYGQRVDLLGQVEYILPDETGISRPIFTANNKAWPAGSGKTFVAFVQVSLLSGTWPPAPEFLQAACAYGLGGEVWCGTNFLNKNGVGDSFGPPSVLYAGTRVNTTGSDLDDLPGAISNGTPFVVTIGTSASLPFVIRIGAYGWAA